MHQLYISRHIMLPNQAKYIFLFPKHVLLENLLPSGKCHKSPISVAVVPIEII